MGIDETRITPSPRKYKIASDFVQEMAQLEKSSELDARGVTPAEIADSHIKVLDILIDKARGVLSEIEAES